jgi:hypothetical protein
MRIVALSGPRSKRPAGRDGRHTDSARTTSSAADLGAGQADRVERDLDAALLTADHADHADAADPLELGLDLDLRRSGSALRPAASPLTDSIKTGDESGSAFWICGGRIDVGRSRIVAMRSRISWAATSGSFSSANCTNTSDAPSDDTDDRVSMPLTVLTAASILSVTSDSTDAGDAPG